MYLSRLHIHAIRNLGSLDLTFHPGFNLICGKNGSGKTSLLEAIYLLSRGRSFRTHQSSCIINHHRPHLSCFGEIMQADETKITLGLEKNRLGEAKYKISGETCDRLSSYATTLPVQLLTPDSFKLLQMGPEERRRFIDWGVFHVEHSFALLSQRYLRLLKQRNAVLKQGATNDMKFFWDKELAETGTQVDSLRIKYLVDLLPFIQNLCYLLVPSLKIIVNYQNGWPSECSLEQALSNRSNQDQFRGFTSVGPHRAEIAISIEGSPVQQVLSRGQLKLLICALYMAQAQHLYAHTGKKCLYLIDDLASELDQDNRMQILTLLEEQKHQIFLTSTDPNLGGVIASSARKMFHVEQGEVQIGDG